MNRGSQGGGPRSGGDGTADFRSDGPDSAQAAEEGPAVCLLDRLGVPWRLVRHPAIGTVEEGLDAGVADLLGIAACDLSKCLLLEDAGGALVLVVAPALVRPDLKAVRLVAGTRRLHLAPPDRLRGSLGSVPGSVSLFDLICHPGTVTTVVLEEGLVLGRGETALHAGTNRASILIPKRCLPMVADSLCGNVVTWRVGGDADRP
ncbi:YbaK/EbsC family protein [Bifidobacterium favimelis]|uniref:YbaK/EbsC family protein n=1 Tax=Bifidobacterium favimelis TaxID=3122979 RepID=A0ABU8ZM16_9BIFI